MMLKNKKEILATSDGSYKYEFNIKDGSNYLMIKTENYSGNIKIDIE